MVMYECCLEKFCALHSLWAYSSLPHSLKLHDPGLERVLVLHLLSFLSHLTACVFQSISGTLSAVPRIASSPLTACLLVNLSLIIFHLFLSLSLKFTKCRFFYRMALSYYFFNWSCHSSPLAIQNFPSRFNISEQAGVADKHIPCGRRWLFAALP